MKKPQTYNSKDKLDSVNQNYSVQISIDPVSMRGTTVISGRPLEANSAVDRDQKKNEKSSKR